mgnify:CR=1 FL=1
MTLYVWRPQSPADAWERFLVGCLDLIRGALGDRPIVDVSDFTRAEVGVRFREQLGVSADGIFLALCHGTGVSLSGSGGELLTTQDAQLFNGKFCYLIACSAGTLFAGHALRAGAIGFVGFTDIVTIQRVGVPDDYAAIWRGALMSGVRLLIRGETSPRRVYQELNRELRSGANKILREKEIDRLQDAILVAGCMMRMATVLTWGPQSST